MFWPIWIALTAVLALASPPCARRAFVVILIGLCLTAAGGALDDAARPYFSAMIWAIAGGCVATIGGGKFLPSALLLIVSGAMKLPARLFGGSYGIGNEWLAVSDLCGLAALFFIGWRVRGEIGDRIAFATFGRLANRASRDIHIREMVRTPQKVRRRV